MSLARQTALASPKAKPASPATPAPMQRPRGPVGNQAALRQLSRAPLGLQPKLEIGAVDDPLEREADEVADKVMRMPDPALTLSSTPPQVSRKCAACEEEDKKVKGKPEDAPAIEGALFKLRRKCAAHEEGNKKTLRAEPGGAAFAGGSQAPQIVSDALASPGKELDAPSRAFFEPRFGADLGDVRLHAGPLAARSAAAVHAYAFTVGEHIVLGAAGADRRLLAHELAHVMQQSGRAAGPSRLVDGTVRGGAPTGSPVVRREADSATPRGGYGVDYRGNCALNNGTLNYVLSPRVGFVNARIEFTAAPNVAAASKTISFIQTVAESVTSGGFAGIGAHTSYSIPQVDTTPSDRDPFYGAKWNQAQGKWGDEPNATQARPGDRQGQGGAREGSKPAAGGQGSAVLNDSPMLNVDETKHFETVAVVVESGAVLGALVWEIRRFTAGFFNETSSTIVRDAHCTEGASGALPGLVEKFYSGDGNVVIDGFAASSADPPAGYEQKLAGIIDQFKKAPDKRVLLGGAATKNEPDPVVLSRNRAEKIKAYLLSQGIADSQIEIENYGSDWARTPVASAGADQANRRVQVRPL
jgi:outer membrane protein OmpA-like peptidoglycan-associated protein